MKTRGLVALFMSAALTTQCAGVRAVQGGASMQTSASTVSATSIRAAAERIPAGSRVKITLDSGRRLTAVLLGVEGDDVIVRERTRIPEPPRRLAASQIAWLELDTPHTSPMKMFAIGTAIGTGVTLAFLAILAAVMSD